MLLSNRENLSCDVLVIGGGGAGLRASIAAKLYDVDVLLVSKTKIGPGSNTYISKAVIASTGWGTPKDDEKTLIADTVKGGCFLNDQSMVAKVAELSHAEITFLKKCGVHFDMHEGEPRVIKTPGHRYPRHVYGINWSGRDLVLPLKRHARQLGVRFAEKVFITRLMTDGNRVCGATGINAEGRFFAINANVVVLATGGYAQIYLNTNNVPGITGDGQALAYDLGIALKDMEFVQFYPTAGGRRGSRLILYERMLAQPGVALRNRRGEDILERYGITDLTKLTRDHLAQLIAMETSADASSDQGVFMDMNSLSAEAAGKLSSILPSRWWKGQKVFRVTPTTHFCMGGIVTDQSGETSIRGLFAVGEVTAGAHGANRLGGNALAEIFTMGSVVGNKAVERLSEMGPTAIPEYAIKEERSRLEKTHANNGVSAKQLIGELKQLMWRKAGVIRRAEDLKDAQNRLEEPLPGVIVSNSVDLIRFLELQNMRCVAGMVCRGAIARTESRGSHFRADYPEEDNPRWLKNIILKRGKKGINLDTKPVRLDLVKMEDKY